MNSNNNVRELLQVTTRRLGLLNKNCCSSNGFSISVVHSHILYEISRQSEPSMQKIADTLGIEVTTFSRQIQKLINEQLITKETNPSDKRSSFLSLTLEGKKLVKSIDQEMNHYIKDIFSKMNEFEKDTVIRSIELLNNAMENTDQCCKVNSL